MPVRPFAMLIPIVLVAACTDGARDDPRIASPSGPTPDVYAGTFPCEDCPGIESTLWLRADGTFFWRQQYLDDRGEPATTGHNLGRWEIERKGTLVLHGAGPVRRFEPAVGDGLLLVTPSPFEHRLSSAPRAPAFADRIRIEAVATVENGTAVISECWTGLSAPARGADMRRFVRQYRSLGFRGDPALVELEARFDWSDDGTLRSFAVERFVRIKHEQRGQSPCIQGVRALVYKGSDPYSASQVNASAARRSRPRDSSESLA